jgi:16S rRNA (guanine966-N2)-methyltransferase
MEVGECWMRVIAGIWRGRRLVAPTGTDTRPTSDRVRESLFSSLTSLLGPDLGGGAVLDAFSGSGALALESLSRGCSSATMVESDRKAVTTIRSNVESLGAAGQAHVVTGDIFALAERGLLPGGPFALILLDPPYRLPSTDIVSMISALGGHDLLEDGAVVVFEHAKGTDIEWPAEFDVHAQKRYGTTKVDIAIFERGGGST